MAARNIDVRHSFDIRIVVTSKPAADDRDALEVSAQNPSRRVTMSLLVPNAFITHGRAAICEKRKQKFFFFLNIPRFSKSFPLRRNDTTLSSARAAATAASSSLFFFLSFPLRSRKFVFVSKSGRLALKKKCLRFRYRRNRIARAYCNSILSSLTPRSDFAFASFYLCLDSDRD